MNKRCFQERPRSSSGRQHLQERLRDPQSQVRRPPRTKDISGEERSRRRTSSWKEEGWQKTTWSVFLGICARMVPSLVRRRTKAALI